MSRPTQNPDRARVFRKIARAKRHLVAHLGVCDVAMEIADHDDPEEIVLDLMSAVLAACRASTRS